MKIRSNPNTTIIPAHAISWRSNKAHSKAHDETKPQNMTKNQKTQNHVFLKRNSNTAKRRTFASTVVTLVTQAMAAPIHSTQTEYPQRMTKQNPNRPRHIPRSMQEHSPFESIALVTMMST